MKLSTKGKYAITAMLDLALNANNNTKITLADISEFQGISLSYLEQLFAKLRKARLVQGTRGPGGGYKLGRPANEISIAEIVDAIDDRSGKKKRITLDPGSKHFATEQLWEELSADIFGYLNHISLGSLVERHKQKMTGTVQPIKGDAEHTWDTTTPTSTRVVL